MRVRTGVAVFFALSAAACGARGGGGGPVAEGITGAASDGAAPPAEEGTTAAASDAARATPTGPSGPPVCAKLGEKVSPEVAGLDATILVFDCDPGPGVDLLINGRIWNHSEASAALMALALHYPMLAFEVRDGAGAAVHGGPPPVPPAEDLSTFVIDLAPNADYSWDAALDSVIAVDLAPGKYEIRLVYENAVADRGWWTGRLETPWVGFELSPTTDNQHPATP